MTPAEIDVAQAQSYDALFEAVCGQIKGYADDLRTAGYADGEIVRRINAQLPRLNIWLAEKRAEIRSLIVAGTYAGVTTATMEGLRPTPKHFTKGSA
jgi:hypothetical protein